MATITKRKQIPKGDRLGWKFITDVRPVKLTFDLVKGVKLTASDSILNNVHHTEIHI